MCVYVVCVCVCVCVLCWWVVSFIECGIGMGVLGQCGSTLDISSDGISSMSLGFMI